MYLLLLKTKAGWFIFQNISVVFIYVSVVTTFFRSPWLHLRIDDGRIGSSRSLYQWAQRRTHQPNPGNIDGILSRALSRKPELHRHSRIQWTWHNHGSTFNRHQSIRQIVSLNSIYSIDSDCFKLSRTTKNGSCFRIEKQCLKVIAGRHGELWW